MITNASLLLLVVQRLHHFFITDLNRHVTLAFVLDDNFITLT